MSDHHSECPVVRVRYVPRWSTWDVDEESIECECDGLDRRDDARNDEDSREREESPDAR